MASFAELVGWLGIGADTFINRTASEMPQSAESLAAAAAHIHADPRLDDRGAEVVVRTMTAAYEALATPCTANR